MRSPQFVLARSVSSSIQPFSSSTFSTPRARAPSVPALMGTHQSAFEALALYTGSMTTRRVPFSLASKKKCMVCMSEMVGLFPQMICVLAFLRSVSSFARSMPPVARELPKPTAASTSRLQYEQPMTLTNR